MNNILRLEQLALFLFSIFMFARLTELPWYFYAGLFFTPDAAFLGYLINTKVGAVCYNFFHHQGLWILIAIIGFSTQLEWVLGLGLVYIGHSAFDRLFGYGLKYPDSFNNTHLGSIGNKAQ